MPTLWPWHKWPRDWEARNLPAHGGQEGDPSQGWDLRQQASSSTLSGLQVTHHPLMIWITNVPSTYPAYKIIYLRLLWHFLSEECLYSRQGSKHYTPILKTLLHSQSLLVKMQNSTPPGGSLAISAKLNMHLPFDPAIPHLGIYPKDVLSNI